MDRFGRLESSVVANLPIDPGADDRACDARGAHAGGATLGTVPPRRARSRLDRQPFRGQQEPVTGHAQGLDVRQRPPGGVELPPVDDLGGYAALRATRQNAHHAVGPIARRDRRGGV